MSDFILPDHYRHHHITAIIATKLWYTFSDDSKGRFGKPCTNNMAIQRAKMTVFLYPDLIFLPYYIPNIFRSVGECHLSSDDKKNNLLVYFKSAAIFIMDTNESNDDYG